MLVVEELRTPVITSMDVKRSQCCIKIPSIGNFTRMQDDPELQAFFAPIADNIALCSISAPGSQPSCPQTPTRHSARKKIQANFFGLPSLMLEVQQQLNLIQAPCTTQDYVIKTPMTTPLSPSRTSFQHQRLVQAISSISESQVISCSMDSVPLQDKSVYMQQEGRFGLLDSNSPNMQVVIGFIIPGSDACSIKKMLADLLNIENEKWRNNEGVASDSTDDSQGSDAYAAGAMQTDGNIAKRRKREVQHDLGRILQQAGIRTLQKKEKTGFNNFDKSFRNIESDCKALVLLFDPETLRKYDADVLSKARVNSEQRRSRGKENFPTRPRMKLSRKKLDFSVNCTLPSNNFAMLPR